MVIWQLDTGQCQKTLVGHEDAVTTLTYDATTIISGSLDCTIRLWCISSGQCNGVLDWMSSEGHTGVIRCLAADPWRIVSASDDKTIKVWDRETLRRLVTLRNHTDGVTCLAFNDHVIVSGSYDKTVKLWDFSVC
ncbi:F-box/WD repeat-containing protein 7 [Penaeus vannamei]|uniref:F-box/WD repeat-containing protein 7 n=1 Tax=Penaeus vannamei TaxID=6689 RepID=A0A3R7QPY8_PENVA|nr:F-box/WD repeat-containing protein 7 [Penaeus vannamei]